MTSKTGGGSTGPKSDGRQDSNSASKFGSKGNEKSVASNTGKGSQQNQSSAKRNAPESTFGNSHGQQDKAGHQKR